MRRINTIECQSIDLHRNGVGALEALRGIAVGTAMVATLTACGGSSAGSAGTQAKAPISFTPDQIRTALVSKAGAPKGWQGSGPRVDLDNGMRTCAEDTESSCGGFVAVGWSDVKPDKDPAYKAWSPEVKFRIYSFRSPDDAKAAMKGLAAEERRSAGANGVETKPLQTSVGADETDAFTGQRTRIMMRVGGLLVLVASQDLREEQPYGDLAKLQIDRIKKTSEGKNPDA
ncbi:hypothetical protein [Nocardia nepalensis]|uniref:hypothetical protein n=1 Tax=Nocardia nepalensis TaxID=3375448 RepID=UPI003B680DF4